MRTKPFALIQQPRTSCTFLARAVALSLLTAYATLVLAQPPDKPAPPPRAKFVPTEQYERRTIEGWTVHVNRRLLNDDAATGTQALRLLEWKLYEVRRVVPPDACRKLQEVPIWLGVDDGHAPCAEYHPSREWLAENGYNPDKARGVEIGNAQRFIDWIHDQPAMVLHELAHAYHHQVLGYDHTGVKDAYARAVAGGKYEQVLHVRGGRQRAYALENDQEFFAELSEAYFGVNDFYPFVRAELEEHDPECRELLRQVWGG